KNNYFLVTIHRAETVDVENNLKNLILAMEKLHETFGLPILCSTHPRTRNKMELFRLDTKKPAVTFVSPLSFFNFVHLEKNAFCVATDSGTVQEECCILQIPSVTLREVTERPETIECGSNVLTGLNPESIIKTVQTTKQEEWRWTPPKEYLETNVSNKVVKLLLGYNTL
ncbi:MAG: UDP-N-acetylglucosamine 2-epimerase, partial [bacterium]|nr:UDP-N-acetylglucosamine 2-epimerase [bacterium]